MRNWKLNILYRAKAGPWGGGNQFLKGLRHWFTERGLYTDEAANADVLLHNSHHHAAATYYWRWRRADARFVHRIDGPIALVRGAESDDDSRIFELAASVADAVVFQSQWSRAQCIKRGFPAQEIPHAVIGNAPDPTVFFRSDAAQVERRKFRLIATSWSPNWKKGFDVYKWLDENLDWSRYEMTFVGNSPVEFDNIARIPPVSSSALATILRDHDIYVTASQDDPCSNSLIEALHCGLPAVARRSGGHPEIVREGGLLFADPRGAAAAIDEVAARWGDFRGKISVKSLDEIGSSYLTFVSALERRRMPSPAKSSMAFLMRNPKLVARELLGGLR